MTQLPAATTGGDMVAFARQRIAFYRDNKMPFLTPDFGDGYSWFNKDDGRRLTKEFIKRTALVDANNMMIIVGCARDGWGDAHDALVDLILEYKNHRQELPTYLAAYDMEITRGWQPRRIRGVKKSDDFLRNWIIISIIYKLMETYPELQATRSSASFRKPSYCSVMAAALAAERLGIGESAVNTVWKNHLKWLRGPRG